MRHDPSRGRLRTDFEDLLCYLRLPDDRAQGALSKFSMIWHDYSNGGSFQLALHHNVAATLANIGEAMGLKDSTYLLAGKNAKLTQPSPR